MDTIGYTIGSCKKARFMKVILLYILRPHNDSF